jgi:2-alkenal reductase
MKTRSLITFLIILTLFSAFSIGLTEVSAQGGDREELPPLPALGTYQPNSAELLTAEVYEQVTRSVVSISVSLGQTGAGGSGFVIDEAGHIVTNNHVVENSQAIQVSFVDGTVVNAELVGRDPDADLAVIRVDPSEVQLFPVVFADSDSVFVGQQVLAIGSPFAQDFTLTQGIVSALDRSLQAETRFTIPELIQTDAAINPGNSGGPLLDMAGSVIGVNTAILSGARSGAGVGFAVPSNTVRRIVPYLIQYGSYQHTYLGISGMTLTPAQQDAMSLPPGTRGVLVTTISPGGPAENAGLQGTPQNAETITTPFGLLPVEGDVIAAINEVPVADMNDLIAYLEENTQPGDTVTLSIWRSGEAITVPVTLQARPSPVQ